MCVVSDKLKLCTCKNAAGTLKHYWVLYRFVNGKEEEMMGEPVMPAFIEPEIDTLNNELLLKLLNEGNAFDTPLYPVKKDRLLLSFGLSDESRMEYGFYYNGSVWNILAYDCFEWAAKHDEIKQGEIESALKKSNSNA